MLKTISKTLLVVALLGFATAQAAPPAQLTCKVVAVEDGKVKVALEGEKPAWAKANAPVKLPGGTGKILELGADGAGTIKTKAASKLKVGDVVKFDKGSAMQGC